MRDRFLGATATVVMAATAAAVISGTEAQRQELDKERLARWKGVSNSSVQIPCRSGSPHGVFKTWAVVAAD
jgi:hypothetical protein